MDSFAELWEMVKEECKNQVSESIYNVWFKDMELVSFDDNRVVIALSDFKRKIVESRFMDKLESSFKNVIGFDIQIVLVDVDKSAPVKVEETEDTLTDEDTFDSFIVGASNKFAYAAANAVANDPGGKYNPLFIHGNSGLGKTHLLNAICTEIKKNNPNAKIIYTGGEDFTNELILSIEKKTMPDFHNKYRTIDVLLVDDIQFIAGKASTQEEFFHTFNALIQDNKQIVLTSDRPPKEISLLEDRIKTRFEWGLLADIQPPDIETRIAIIKRKAALMSFELPDEVVQYIAEKIKNNVRQLEGAVKKINALCTISGHEPSIIIAQKAIKDILSDNQPLPVTITKILDEVARTYGTTTENILSKKRNANISEARQAAMYIVREVTSLPMEKIGEEFGGKHHSTVIYNISQMEEKMNSNATTRATIQGIINNINDKATSF